MQTRWCVQELQESALYKELKASAPFFLMAGPNVIQSEAHCLKMCRQIKVWPFFVTAWACLHISAVPSVAGCSLFCHT